MSKVMWFSAIKPVVVVDVETSCLCSNFVFAYMATAMSLASARYQASRSSLDAKEQTCCRRKLGSMEKIYWSLYWIERIGKEEQARCL